MTSDMTMTQEMYERLNQAPLISVITVNPDNLIPQINAVSWLRAHPASGSIRIALGHQSECVLHFEKGSPIALGWMDEEGYWLIHGSATLSELKKGTIKYRILELKMESVQDVMFYGGAIEQTPSYRKTYDPVLAKKIDEEIEAELLEGWN